MTTGPIVPLRPSGQPVKLGKGWETGYATLHIPTPLLLTRTSRGRS
jgi:hypothetical protein